MPKKGNSKIPDSGEPLLPSGQGFGVGNLSDELDEGSRHSSSAQMLHDEMEDTEGQANIGRR